MATPAEIIAARVNGTYVPDVYDEPVSSPKDSEASETSRSLKDESAFPVLGGSSKNGSASPVASSASSWGPNSTGSPAAPVSATFAAQSAPKKKNLSSTVQEAFSLDAEDQLNMDRTEFIKALQSIKSATSTNIECTTSLHTKKRTFLITGKPQEVKHAKRLVIKKMTKPVSVSFSIPAKLRSRVIGPQGRVLRPIVQENEVKVDIGNVDESESPSGDEGDDEDDIFAKKITVLIQGDAEGCKSAKAQILAIVKEETKHMQIRIVVDDIVKPFVAKAIEPVLAKFPNVNVSVPPFDSAFKAIIVDGDREETLEARDQIKAAIAQISAKIVTVSVPIPQIKHKFLPIEQVLEENNVLIKLPQQGETTVSFIGERKDIAAAQEKARSTTSQYKVEVLDMSKAHKGNLAHVKTVAALLSKNGTFDKIASDHSVVINAPSTAELEDESQTTIPIEIVAKNDDVENTKNAKKAIVSTVNKITPQQTKTITDIDAFFISRVPSVLDQVEGAQFVILNDKIVLFDVSEADEGEDFEDFQETPSYLDAADKALSPLRELSSTLATVVLKVPSAEQADISGPHGSTLKAIMSLVGHNSVVVTLHSDGKNKSADEVCIHGLKHEVALIQKDIQTVLAEAKEYKATGGFKTVVEVPTFTISRVIGKGGANLKNIKDEFGVKIDIPDNGRDGDNVTDKSLKSEVVISGIKRNVEGAKHAIAQIAKKLADDTLVRVRIEAEYHRRIVGPNFSSINRLQDKYNVKISFPSEKNNDHSDAPKSKNEITIRGPSKGVAKAEEELKELYDFERENGHKSTLQIPTKAMPRVIGRSGETIRDITDSTGVDYRFNTKREEEEELGFAEIELTGSKSALKEATQKIKDIINEAENFVTVTIHVPPKYYRDLVGSGGSVMRAMISKAGGDELSTQQYSRLLNIPSEDSGLDAVVCQGDKKIVESLVEQIKAIVAEKEAAVTEEYDLAKEKHKLIIGPGGSIRHQLQDESGVQIIIPRPNEPSTIIKLVGLPEKIAALKTKLDDLTKDNWNESIDVPIVYHAWVSERGAILKRLRTELGVDVTHGNLTRKATNLSNAAIPTPPQDTLPEDGASTKFTVGDIPATDGGETVIPWRFIGSPEATAKAAQIIQEQLDRAKTVTHSAWFYSANSSSDFPKIIGPQGSRINKIRKSTGAFITVPRTNQPHSNYIYLVGTEASLQEAQKAFAKLV